MRPAKAGLCAEGGSNQSLHICKKAAQVKAAGNGVVDIHGEGRAAAAAGDAFHAGALSVKADAGFAFHAGAVEETRRRGEKVG
ncbi:MAG: hypothetical protein KH196_12095 [Oscillospiraceae bacterium]|nr:hypothetical protein [Oscillospiraceae bacterium]